MKTITRLFGLFTAVVVMSCFLPQANAATLQGRLVYQDDFSVSNAVWQFALMGTQDDPTAIAASYGKIEGGYLQLKANVGCGWDFLGSWAKLELPLPSEYIVEYRMRKPQWCGTVFGWIADTLDIPIVDAPSRFSIGVDGSRFLPLNILLTNAQPTIGPISQPFVNGSWYNYRIVKTHNNLKVFVNDSLQYSYTGSTFDGGFLKFLAVNSGSILEIDDLRIYDLGIPLTIETAAVRLRWPTESNVTYQVQWTTNLTDWADLISILGTGSETNIVEWIENPRRFYRVFAP